MNGKDDFKIQVKKLILQPSNKICCECSQKGPIYADITVGSFICSSCSGEIRGLIPPHRVKNISMSSFTKKEYEMLASMGNAKVNALYLGKAPEHLKGINSTTTTGERRLYLTKKYDKKVWMIDETEMEKMKSSAVSASNSGQQSINPSSKKTTIVTDSIKLTTPLSNKTPKQNLLGENDLALTPSSQKNLKNVAPSKATDLDDIFKDFNSPAISNTNQMNTNLFSLNAGSVQQSYPIIGGLPYGAPIRSNVMFNSQTQPHCGQNYANQFQPSNYTAPMQFPPQQNSISSYQQFQPNLNSQFGFQTNTPSFGVDTRNSFNVSMGQPQFNPQLFGTSTTEYNSNFNSTPTSQPPVNDFSWIQNIEQPKQSMAPPDNGNSSSLNLIELTHSSGVQKDNNLFNQGLKTNPKEQKKEAVDQYPIQNNPMQKNFDIPYRNQFF